MKTLILLVLAVIGIQAAVIQTSARAGLNVGFIGAGDRLLHRAYVSRPAMANTVQYQDVVYRGNYATRISAVQAFEVGATQFASARIIAGGINANNVTIRFETARGRGFYYDFSIWGR